MPPAPAIELTGVRKDYHGLRPLRIDRLTVGEDEIVALAGLDLAASEILTSLVTGATLAEAGEVRIFGRATSDLENASAWLAFVEQFGIVSERVALLDAFSVEQNLTIPFTLDLHAPDPAILDAVTALAVEVGLGAGELDLPMTARPPLLNARVRLARASALDPRVLLLEHPTAGLARPDVPVFAADVRRVARRRKLAVLAVTGDAEFARAVADRVLAVDPSNGTVRAQGIWRRLLGRVRLS
jgi:ABC-type transporter Mla maintaining outer membrane lipid asymmetry ATPase subunit MlaF